MTFYTLSVNRSDEGSINAGGQINPVQPPALPKSWMVSPDAVFRPHAEDQRILDVIRGREQRRVRISGAAGSQRAEIDLFAVVVGLENSLQRDRIPGRNDGYVPVSALPERTRPVGLVDLWIDMV